MLALNEDKKRLPSARIASGKPLICNLPDVFIHVVINHLQPPQPPTPQAIHAFLWMILAHAMLYETHVVKTGSRRPEQAHLTRFMGKKNHHPQVFARSAKPQV